MVLCLLLVLRVQTRGTKNIVLLLLVLFWSCQQRDTEKDTRKREDDAAMRMRSEKGAERQGKKRTT